MNNKQQYNLNQSPFYRVKNRRKLAHILQVNLKEINDLTRADENFIRFKTETGRDIQWPKPRLRKIQKRAAILLSRIEVPEFLHSAVKGRSYITNAKQHNIVHPCVKVDIKQFFKCSRAPAIFHFFHDKLQCAPDVAGILTKLLTADGHLATGGNASPILSYFAYMDMFSEIFQLAKSRDGVMTCFVDDMAFTGPRANPELIYQVRRIIARHRLHAHKTKYFVSREPRVITGVAVTVVGHRLPNKLQASIANDRRLISRAKSDDDRIMLLRRAIGRAQAAAQIEPRWQSQAAQLITRRKEIERRLEVASLLRSGEPPF
jgi:RNA-directed DNA polymerase